MKKNAKKGFTIIEMVIVIAIIGILAAVLIPTYGNVVANANESAAMQTARSTMTNWLANSTTAAGVPTSGNDANGNPFYAAYFEYKNESNNAVYQFRYTSGGVERTDNNPSMYVNFTQAASSIGTLTGASLPQFVKEAYLTTEAQDAGMAKEPTKYIVSLYKQTVTGTGGTSINYYIKYDAKSAYTCGGADVYAAVSGKTTVYYKNGSDWVTAYLDGTTDTTHTGSLTWTDTPATAVTYTAIALNKNTTSIAVSANETLTATTTPAGGTVTWTTSDATIATVDATGKVVGVAAGEATITAKIGDKTATCTVTVTAP